MKLTYTCTDCDADFRVNHRMDEDYYEVNFCPFCGAEVECEEEDEDEDE